MRNVYLLGAGCIGSLVASELLQASKGKITIISLLRSKEKLAQFEAQNYRITIDKLTTGDKSVGHLSGAMLSSFAPREHIEYLIVSVKTPATVSSLRPLLPSITPRTKIMLIQNGMGVVEELYAKLWPDPETRPTVFQAVIGHGVFQDPETAKTDPFRFSLAGSDKFKVALVPRDLSEVHGTQMEVDEILAKDELSQLLLKSAELNATLFSYPQFFIMQCRKFLLNSCVNPIGSILDCFNGEMDPLADTRSLYASIITEAKDILFKARPFLQETPGATEAFDIDDALAYVVEAGIVINAKNSCSMRQDCINLKDIEIDYINGFIVTLAESMGVSAPVNKTIAHLARMRLGINRNRAT